MTRVVIVGGGITGLTAAYKLARARGHAPPKITLIESEPRLGGKIKTCRERGFVVEQGPDSIFTRKPWALELIKELGLEEHLVALSGEAETSYIVRGGRLFPAPQGWAQLTPGSIRSVAKSRLISLRGKVRMAADLFISAGTRRLDEDESIGAFFARRLGREAVDYLVDPMMGGIHAGDVWKLSLLASHPHFRALEQKHGGLIRAALARRDAGSTKANTLSPAGESPFVSLRNGLEMLVETLEASLEGVDVLKGRRVRTIERSDAAGRVPDGDQARYRVCLDDGETIPASALILTTPAYVTAELLQGIAPQASALLRRLEYTSVITATLVFRRSDVGHGLRGSGFVVPSREVRSITACTWYSSKWAHSTPSDYIALRAHMGRSHIPAPIDATDEEIVAAVRTDLRRLMGLDAQPVMGWVDRWPMAMPQYHVGHGRLVDAIEASLDATPHILLAGAAYRGLGIPDCVRQGARAAETLLNALRERQPDPVSISTMPNGGQLR